MDVLLNRKAVILDMDGTLYYQRPVRFCMAMRMMLLIFRPHGLRALKLVLTSRKLYEDGLDDAGRIRKLAERFCINPAEVKVLIRTWMIEKPMFFVRFFRDRQLIAQMEQAQRYGVKLIVLSDYPVKEKLNALGFQPDAAYTADELGCLKPQPNGLIRILEEHGLSPAECLLIGDREDKDGELAKNTGMDYLILPCQFIKRKLRMKGIYS